MRDRPEFKLNFYPAYAFSASPTYFAWVKLTATDIHDLKVKKGFEGQGLYFHLNHPVRWVCLTAPIVAIEHFVSKAVADKFFAVLTLDDGSGAALAAKFGVRTKGIGKGEYVPTEKSSGTNVKNLDAYLELGSLIIKVDGKELDIGTVIKVKGAIEDFRGQKQILIKRIQIMHTTTDEMAEWRSQNTWYSDTLNRPWYLGKRKLKLLEEQDQAKARQKMAEERDEADKLRVHAVKKRERAARRLKREEKAEFQRRKEDVLMNKGALI